MDRKAIQAGINRFVEHHTMVHSGTMLGLNIDSFMLVLIVSILIVMSIAVRLRPRGKLVCAAEAYLVFIRDNIVYANLGAEEGRRFVPFFSTLFIFIAVANLVGLVPSKTP